MPGLTLTLSDLQRERIDAKVEAGAFPNADAYIAALIDADARREAEEQLETLLHEGLNSPLMPVSFDFADHLRNHIRQVAARQQQHG
jgi:Arc/MetJ-type ribon-helix-helix transcriptional regulator